MTEEEIKEIGKKYKIGSTEGSYVMYEWKPFFRELSSLLSQEREKMHREYEILVNTIIDTHNIEKEEIRESAVMGFDPVLVELWNFFALEKDHHGKQRTSGGIPSLMKLHQIVKDRGLIKGSGQLTEKGKEALSHQKNEEKI